MFGQRQLFDDFRPQLSGPDAPRDPPPVHGSRDCPAYAGVVQLTQARRDKLRHPGEDRLPRAERGVVVGGGGRGRLGFRRRAAGRVGAGDGGEGLVVSIVLGWDWMEF